MGNYFFRRTVLMDALRRDADDTHGAHDFGRDVVPGLVRSGRRVRVYDFGTNRLPGEREGSSPYWRDVGTIDSLFQANVEVGSPAPGVNLYNRLWRIRTAQRDYPPARLLPNLKVPLPSSLHGFPLSPSAVPSPLSPFPAWLPL